MPPSRAWRAVRVVPVAGRGADIRARVVVAEEAAGAAAGGLAAGRCPTAVNKDMWVAMLRAAGLDDRGMARWHAEFERRAPADHQDFLASLGIPEHEILRIRKWSAGLRR